MDKPRKPWRLCSFVLLRAANFPSLYNGDGSFSHENMNHRFFKRFLTFAVYKSLRLLFRTLSSLMEHNSYIKWSN